MSREERSHAEPADGADGESPTFEDLFSEYLDQLNEGKLLDPDQIRADHPDVGEELLEGLRAFIGFGSEDERSNGDLGTLGDYTLRRQIGRGGMGVVYAAWENSLDRLVALKVLPSAVASDTRTVSRFVREAQVAGKLHHPNVVSVYGMGLKEQTPFYAMEFVEGETLAHILTRLRAAEGTEEEKKRTLLSISRLFGKEEEPAGQEEVETPPRKSSLETAEFDLEYYARVAKAFAGVSEGLQHAHAKGVIHRDIKPSNLILDREGRLRILDFGLARLEGQESLTATGDFLGTVLYMSPEQAMARRIPLDHRTDVYSLGATLYEMLTWQPPFTGKNAQDTLSQIMLRDPESLRKRNPRIPRDLETIVLKCLRKDAADRYGTAEALAQDLRRFARGDPIEARPLSAWEKALTNLWRRRRAAGTVVAVLLVVLSLALVLHMDSSRRRSERDRVFQEAVEQSVLELQLYQLAGSQAGDPLDPEGIVSRWGLEWFLGEGPRSRLEDTRRALEAACEIAPWKGDAQYHYARSQVLLGHGKKALERLDLAGENLPAARALTKALLRRLTHEASGAADNKTDLPRDFGERERLWFSYHSSLLNRDWETVAETASALLDRQRGEGAASHVGASIELRTTLAQAQMETGEYGAALLGLAVVRDALPERLEPALLVGKAFYLLGTDDEASAVNEECYEGAQPGEKDQVAGWVLLMYHSLRDWDQAKAWARRIADPKLRQLMLIQILTDEGKHDEALQEAEAAVDRFGDDPQFHISMGLVRQARDEFKPAIASFRTAHDMAPGDVRALLALGGALCKARNFKEGLPHLYAARKLQPLSITPLLSLGTYQRARGETEKALDVLNQAHAIAPDSWQVNTSLGLCHMAQGEYQVAARRIQRATRLVRDNSGPWLCLGWVYYTMKDFEAATAAYEKALELLERSSRGVANQENRSEAYCYYGAALEKLGKPEAAEEAYQKGLAACPESAPSLYDLALHFLEEEKTDQAIELLRRATSLDPGFAAGHSKLGLWLVNAGTVEEGVEQLERAVELEPNNYGHLGNLGYGYFIQKRYTEAVDAYQRSISILEKHLEETATYMQLSLAYCYLAQSLAFLDRADEAADAVAKARARAPQTATCYDALGKILLQGRLYQSARDLLRAAVNLDEKHAMAHSRLGLSLVELGEFEEAFRHLEKAVSLDPGDPWLRIYLAKGNYQNREYTKAIARYQEGIKIMESMPAGAVSSPKLAWVYGRLGSAHYVAGDTSSAFDAWVTALSIDARCMPAALQLAAILQKEGITWTQEQLERVDDVLQPMLKSGASDPPLAFTFEAFLRAVRSNPATSSGKGFPVLDYARAAVELSTGKPLADRLVLLVEILLEKGLREEADTAIEKARNLPDVDPNLLKRLEEIRKGM